MTDPKAGARLIDLARLGAEKLHSLGIQFYGEWGHVGPFDECPHPDCVLVREAAQQHERSESMLLEELARYAHEAWSRWMKHIWKLYPPFINDRFDCVIIEGESRERWDRQMNTPYADLTEDEKESDRKEARRILAITREGAAALSGSSPATPHETRSPDGDGHEKGTVVARETSAPERPTAPQGVVEALGAGAGSNPVESHTPPPAKEQA